MSESGAEYTPTTEEIRDAATSLPRVMGVEHLLTFDPAAAFDRWLAEYVCEALKRAADEVEAHYPEDLWPCTTSDQIDALHAFARTLGLPDASRFHVDGIRHALAQIRQASADDRSEG